MITSAQQLAASARDETEPPSELSGALKALWLAKAGRWDEAHELAQSLGNSTGDWIHAHLHVIEGDLGNAGYWYRRADKPASPPEQLEAEWTAIAEAILREE